jgi:hypothetical protein
MKVTELKEQLRRLKQPVSGTKALLQERLKAALLETPVTMSSVKPVGGGGGGAKAVVDDEEEEEEEEDEQILPPLEGETVAPWRKAAPSSWAEREAPDYGATGGRGGGWRADEEEWDDAAEDGVQLGQEMEAEVSVCVWGGGWGCLGGMMSIGLVDWLVDWLGWLVD